MEYILISMLTIAIFTYIVFIVTSKLFATKIHMKSLILCGCCALLISLILPRMFMGFAGLSGTLAILIAFAMLSSYFIASYYDSEMQKLALTEDNTTAVIFADTPQIPEQEDIKFVLDLATILKSPENTQFSAACEEEEEEEEESLPSSVELPLVSEVSLDTYGIKEVADELDAATLQEDLITETILEEVADELDATTLQEESIMETILEEAVDELDAATLQEQLIIETILEEVTDELDAATLQEESIIETILEEVTDELDAATLQEESIMETTLEETTDELSPVPLQEELLIDDSPENSHPNSNELDDLMDFAFLQKEQRKSLKALETFRQALHLYPNSEVAPFLIVEIGTILKIIGSYDEAIEIFMEGRLLPSVINNSILEQEFINNIAYLRIVKNILVENSLGFSPFNLIPENALKQIDDNFCEWRNQL